MRHVVLAGIVLLLAPVVAARADDDVAAQRKAAIEKGVKWLEGAQAADGSWDHEQSPFRAPFHMKQGATALAVLSLLRSGVGPDDPAVKKAFAFLESGSIEHTYEAGCILLAIEARYNWEPPREDESVDGDSTREKRAEPKKQKPSARDLALAKKCVEFLVKAQSESGGWSYLGGSDESSGTTDQPRGSGQGPPGGGPPPGGRGGGGRPGPGGPGGGGGPNGGGPNGGGPGGNGGGPNGGGPGGNGGGGGRPPAMEPDLSNTQYALLGLDAAERLDLNAPKTTYEKALAFVLSKQDTSGAAVDPFPVPGADQSYKDLKKTEADLREKLKQIDGAFKGKKAGETNAAGRTEADERRTTTEDAARKVLRTTDAKGTQARGWNYGTTPPGPNGQEAKNRSGSMTTAGLACVFICKAHLEGRAAYDQKHATVDKSLRDGAAWLAKNFEVEHDPAADSSGGAAHAGHLYYYLYGLERAGVLLLVPRLGAHDWYDAGCQAIVKSQADGGKWDAGNEGTVGAVCDTSFALLFLARGTTPLVRIPTRTVTGVGDAKK